MSTTPDGATPVHDAIVVGGGAAGLAAATWIARYRRSVLVVDGGEPRNRWVDQAHGYLGADPVHPGTLLERAREEVTRYEEVTFRSAPATRAWRREDGVFVVESDGQELEARRLVLATGVLDRFPEVDRFFEHYGADVFHCPTCDGYEARDTEVVVFGWNEDITGFALTLLGWARSVVIVTDGRPFEGDEGCRRRLEAARVPVLEDDAVELLGRRGALEGVRLRGGEVLDCQLAFFSIAHEPRTDLARQLGCRLTAEGCIEVDRQQATSVPGVFAAGDVTPGLQILQVAAAGGATAGVACARSLRGEGDVPDAWRGRAPGYSTPMTDPTEEETTNEGDDEVHGDPAPPPDDDSAGTEDAAAPGGEEAGPEDTPPGQEAEAGGRSGETRDDPSPPRQLLDALGDEIDEVRRRTAGADPSQAAEEETLVEEGEADRDQPTDDTVAPPA